MHARSGRDAASLTRRHDRGCHARKRASLEVEPLHVAALTGCFAINSRVTYY